MWITTMATVLSVVTAVPEPGDAARFVTYRHQEAVPAARIWFDRGVDPVLESGDRVRVYYRSTVTAFVAIFQVDTDGTVRLVYPRSPSENHFARANREYRLLFPRSPYWNVSDRPGVGYFFVVTSPVPFDFSDFHYSYYGGGWDLSVVGNRVYQDPYVAMDDYVARLIPNWEYAEYGLDFVSYSVGALHEYPRFLCYDCHGFKPFNVWDPYRYTCTNFRVVVYDDPYFYPSRRYRGDQVVMVGRSIPNGPRFGFKERARGESGTPVVVRVPPVPSEPEGGAVDRGRAIPRGDADAVSRPNSPQDRSAGDGAVRVRPPVTRQGEADQGRSTPSGVRGFSPTTTPDTQRPVLRRRPPKDARPSEEIRSSPGSRVDPSRPRSREEPGASAPATRPATPMARPNPTESRADPDRSRPTVVPRESTRPKSSPAPSVRRPPDRQPAVSGPPTRSKPSPAVRRPPTRSKPSPAVGRPPTRSKPSPAVRRPPARPNGAAAKRSAPPRSSPAVKKAPVRRSGAAPTRRRRPGG